MTHPAGLARASVWNDARAVVADLRSAELAAVAALAALLVVVHAARIVLAPEADAAEFVGPVAGGAQVAAAGMADTGPTGRAREAGVPFCAALRIAVALDTGRAMATAGAVRIADRALAVGAADFPASPTTRRALLGGLDALAMLAGTAAILALFLAGFFLFLLRAGSSGGKGAAGGKGAEQGAARLDEIAREVVEEVAVHEGVSSRNVEQHPMRELSQ
ncbi:MAG: hypothetical protein R2853_14710 [Thermomicrobiales bacterium]